MPVSSLLLGKENKPFLNFIFIDSKKRWKNRGVLKGKQGKKGRGRGGEGKIEQREGVKDCRYHGNITCGM